MKKYKFRLAAYTDSAGKTNPDAPRNGNEDNMFVCADLSSKGQETLFSVDKEESLSKGGCLLVVADGMGGMNAGEVASEIAINVVKESFSPDTIQSSVFESPKTRARFMEGVVVRADEAIKRHAEQNSECEGMGSTLIMAWLYEGKVTVTWCGDSRAYLYRPGVGLKQISKDHSYVQELVDEGKITMDEAFDHPYNNVITRSLGDQSKKAKADSVTIPIFLGDIIMVNSDGLSGVLRDKELESLISSNCQTMSGCRAALWEAAEKADWYDNVTAILCEITEGTDYDPSIEESVSDGLDKSFFNFRISKRRLKWVLAALTFLLLAAICFLTIRTCHKPTADENVVVEDTSVNDETPNEDTTVDKTIETVVASQPSQEPEKKSIKDKIAPQAKPETTDTLSRQATEPKDSSSPRRRLTPAGMSGSKPLDNGQPAQKNGANEGEKERPRLTPAQGGSAPSNPLENKQKADTSKVNL